MQAIDLFAYLSLFLFSFATAMLLTTTLQTGWSEKARNIGWMAFVAGSIALIMTTLYSHDSQSIPRVYFILASSIAAAILFISARFKTTTLALFASPVLTLLLVFSFFSRQASTPQITYQQPLLITHVSFAILGSVFSILASIVAFGYLVQNKALKDGRLEYSLPAIPTLEKLESMLGWLLWLGLLFILISLGTGSVYTYGFVETITYSAKVKIVWSLIVFCWYSMILILKNFQETTTATVAKLTLVGFIILATTLFGLWFGPMES